MSGNKTECQYLCRDKDHPSFLFSIAKNEDPFEKYVGVCTASCDFPGSVQWPKVTEEDIYKYCKTIPKFIECIRYKKRVYGLFK